MAPSFFDRALTTGSAAPVDVCERENEFIVRLACAGCRPDDIDVTVEDDVVRIRGRFPDHHAMGHAEGEQAQQPGTQRQGQPTSGPPTSGQPGQPMEGQRQSGPREQCLIRELPVGRFERDITLPMGVNAPEAQAHFEDGLLTLTLPKARAAQGRRIQIGHGARQTSSPSVNQGKGARSG